MTRRDRLLLAAVAVAQMGVLLPVALTRPCDNDEGEYLYATKAVLEGLVPYRDFVYHQMPLYPYLLAAWCKLFGLSYEAVRVLNVAFTAALGCLLCVYIWQVTARRRYGLLAAALFVSSHLVLLWTSTAKTYALTMLLLFASYMLARAGRPLASGIAAGLVLDMRLLVLPVIPILAWASRANLRRFLLGLLACLLLPMAFFLAYPQRFVFCNLFYHSMRNKFGLIADFGQKLDIVRQVMGLQWEWNTSLQLPLLIWLGVAALLRFLQKESQPPLLLAMAAAMAMVSLLPTPSFVQYFVVTVPFLIATAVEMAAALADRITPPALSRTFVSFLGTLAAAYLLVPMVSKVADYFPPSDYAFDLSEVHEVAAEIDRLTRPGDIVFSTWPGYLVGTHAVIAHGLENIFGLDRPDNVQLDEHGIMSCSGARRLLAGRSVRLVVLGALKELWTMDRAAYLAGYRPVSSKGQVEFLMLRVE